MPFQQIPPDVTLPGFEMASTTQPCFGETVSGDGLFVEIDRTDGANVLLMVDVAGHGPPTEVLMDCLIAAFSDQASENIRPGELLTRLNGSLQTPLLAARDANDKFLRFVCALALRLDASQDEAIGVNASLPRIQVQPPGGSWQEWPVLRRPFLRLLDPSAVYTDGPVPFVAGQRILAFTDGVTEAGQHSLGVQFETSLPTFLAGVSATATPAEVVGDLRTAVQNHVGAIWPEDDTTIFCVQRC